ncbi:MAG: hypothetical protein UY71_C0024G0001, partial [Parcubacteria group bacterium GW2011_GWB1_52_7]
MPLAPGDALLEQGVERDQKIAAVLELGDALEHPNNVLDLDVAAAPSCRQLVVPVDE